MTTAAAAKKAAPRKVAAAKKETVASAKAQWKAEMERLSNHLNEEAKNHDLCDEYRDVIAEANKFLTFPLSTPEEDVEIVITLHLTTTTSKVNLVKGSNWHGDTWRLDLPTENKLNEAVDKALTAVMPGVDLEELEVLTIEVLG